MYLIYPTSSTSFGAFSDLSFHFHYFVTLQLISKAEKIIIARAKEANKHIRFEEDWVPQGLPLQVFTDEYLAQVELSNCALCVIFVVALEPLS